MYLFMILFKPFVRWSAHQFQFSISNIVRVFKLQAINIIFIFFADKMATQNMFLFTIASMLWAGLVSSAPLNTTNLATAPTVNGTATVFSLQHGRSATGIRVVLYLLRGTSMKSVDLVSQQFR